jgi:hypothetical protein
MDKKLILAVAGSGKTSYIINELNLEKRFLLITYTINNTKNIREEIIKKFGYFPKNIELYSYYPFLYSFCFKPFLSYKIKVKGIYWDAPPGHTKKLRRSSIDYYLSPSRRLYHNRIARMLEEAKIFGEINERLAKYYDYLFIDEVQDFGGHDFSLLKSMVNANITLLFVGDFFQHTFDTSRDGSINSGLHDNFERYKQIFKNTGMSIDLTLLEKSYRCSLTVCEFITKNLGIDIKSHRTDITSVELIEDQSKAEEIFKDNEVVKLFYQESYRYRCYSKNWGDCKGENCYNDVCVVLNPTTYKLFKEGKLINLAGITKNKFYVACSRSKRNLYFTSEELVKKFKTPKS